MKALILDETFVPVPGGEYLVDQYPGTGLYQKHSGGYVVVYLSGSVRCCVTLDNIPLKDLQEPAPKDVKPAFSEGFVLKALAIAQNPALAVQLDI